MSRAKLGVHRFKVLQPNMSQERIIIGVGSMGTPWSVTLLDWTHGLLTRMLSTKQSKISLGMYESRSMKGFYKEEPWKWGRSTWVFHSTHGKIFSGQKKLFEVNLLTPGLDRQLPSADKWISKSITTFPSTVERCSNRTTSQSTEVNQQSSIQHCWTGTVLQRGMV